VKPVVDYRRRVA